MRRPSSTDDTVPHLNGCGHMPEASYGRTSVISCAKCGMTVTVETPPFFRDEASQRQHEAWRATETWNATLDHHGPFPK